MSAEITPTENPKDGDSQLHLGDAVGGYSKEVPSPVNAVSGAVGQANNIDGGQLIVPRIETVIAQNTPQAQSSDRKLSSDAPDKFIEPPPATDRGVAPPHRTVTVGPIQREIQPVETPPPASPAVQQVEFIEPPPSAEYLRTHPKLNPPPETK
jgi:hypothetical protein